MLFPINTLLPLFYHFEYEESVVRRPSSSIIIINKKYIITTVLYYYINNLVFCVPPSERVNVISIFMNKSFEQMNG